MPDPRDERKMPPIPDGGLSESMPEWLRRPPAWRTLEDNEVVHSEPGATDELPEPDTSIIDPRAFLTDDDLPMWLRNMGRGLQAAKEPPGDDDAGDSRAEPNRDERATTRAEPAAASRFVPRTPPVAAGPGSTTAADPPSTPVRLAGFPDPPATPWWQGMPIVVSLTTLLLGALIVIVILMVV